MRLLIDMKLSPLWAVRLHDAGFEAEHWSQIGAPNASDTEIMAFARTNGYVVLTHDLDFCSILSATHGDKPSVAQIRAEDLSPGAIGGFVANALRRMSAELASGALLTIDPRRMRVRLRPLPPK